MRRCKGTCTGSRCPNAG